MKDMTYEQACDAVINAASQTGVNNMLRFAATYADAGKRMRTHEARRVQSLYILHNITSWRGEDAKKVREFFKNYSKGAPVS